MGSKSLIFKDDQNIDIYIIGEIATSILRCTLVNLCKFTSGFIIIGSKGNVRINVQGDKRDWDRQNTNLKLCTYAPTMFCMMTSSNGNIFRGEFPAPRPVSRSFDVYFDLRPNKQLSKQSWGWWFDTLSCSLWRHCNGSHKCDSLVLFDLYMLHKLLLQQGNGIAIQTCVKLS